MRIPNRPRAGGNRRILHRFRALGVGILAGALAFGGLAAPANAATVYEITGEWDAGTPAPPATVARGEIVNAVWRVNVNDDRPAPSNDPVDNVTFSVTLEHGLFKALPDICLTSGVTPASSISADGRTLTCNVGTKDQGTAIVVGTPVVVDGLTGEQLGATGTIGGQTAALPKLDIKNTFGMDMQFGTNSSSPAEWNGTLTQAKVSMQWSLRLKVGSDPGPQTVTYRLTMTDSNGSAVSVAPAIPGAGPDSQNAIGCGPFDFGTDSTNPWSGLPTGSRWEDARIAPFVQSCTLVPVAGQPGKFDLTLSGIDYSLLQNPSKDSAGNSLPTDWDYVASGSLWFNVATTTAGSLSLASSAPTYTSVTGLKSTDLTSNNTTSKTYTLPGAWSSSWNRPFTRDGGVAWDDTYRVSAGTVVRQLTTTVFYADNVSPNATYGSCQALDTKYLTYVPGVQVFGRDTFAAGAPLVDLTAKVKIEYYTGTSALLNPASASYNPDQFDCGTATGWTTVEPAPSAVKAVRITYPHSTYASNGVTAIDLYTRTQVKPGTPVGQDVWEFGSALRNGNWTGPASQQVLTPTAGARYPHTNYHRDILRIVSATPSVKKSADRAVVKPGEPATFTLTYAANTSTSTLPQVNGYKIVDILPVGMRYVPGSATPAPAPPTFIGTPPNQQQVLTWTLNGVTTNVEHALTYQATVDPGVKAGTVLTNTATSSYGGTTSPAATAQVTLTTSGYTSIVKTADSPYIPNTAGDGKGSGAWTVTIRSYDPQPQKFTDTIDILPYVGDSRGTAYSGSYTLTSVTPPPGATVYYTTADPATLSDDPSKPANGAAGNVTGNTVGWTTSYTPNATAVRVITGPLAPGATSAFQVKVTTNGAEGGDKLVNRAQGIAENTRLVMRTSEPITIANYYSAALKKYVQDRDGNWHDANDAVDYPTFRAGDTVKYRIVVENTGKAPLKNVKIVDDKFSEGAFVVDELKPADLSQTDPAKRCTVANGCQEVHEYEVTLSGDFVKNQTLVNTACATADTPADAPAPTINCDPAGIEIVGAVSWAKTDSGKRTLEGSEWKLTGPSGATSAEVAVIDCVEAAAADCTGPDTDPRAGHFTVDGLAWGDYVLVETKAPAGYVLDQTPHPVTIDQGAKVDLGEIVNRQQAPLQIPLTGGTGTLLFTGGGILVLGAVGALLWIRARRRAASHEAADA